MAKKRRLNRRVVVVLGILLAIMLALGGLGAYQYRDKLFPKDPVLYAARGDEAYGRGDYGAALRAYKVAAGANQNPVYYFKLARVELDWAIKATDLKDVERRKHYEQGRAFLNHALLLDARLLDAQKLKCDLVWDEAVGRGQWEAYIREADKLLALDPKDHKTTFRRAVADARLAQTVKGEHAERAAKGFQAAIDMAPHQVDYWMGLAQLHLNCSTSQQVQETFVQAVKANPSSTLLRVSYADFLRRLDLKEEARKQFEQAIENNRKDAMGYLCLAGFYLAENAAGEAAAVLEKGKQEAGNDYRLFRDLARLYARRGEPAKAVEELRRGLMVAAAKGSADEGHAPVEDGRWQMSYLLANSLLDMIDARQGDKEKLLAEARGQMDLFANDKKDTPQYAKLAGRVAAVLGQLPQAAALLEKASAGFGPSIDQQTANLLINLYLAQNLPGKAEKIVDQILAMPGQRNNPLALLAKANLLMRYRDYAAAQRYVQAVLQRYPDNAEARTLQVALQVLAGDVVTLPPNAQLSGPTVGLLLERSSLLWFNEKREEALALAEQINQAAPKNLAVASQLISLYLTLNQSQKLQELMARLRKELPDNQEIQFQAELIQEKDASRRLAMRLERAEKIEGPFERCLAKAEIYALQGKEAEYVAQLLEALAHKSGQADVLDRLFRHSVSRGNWELADKTLAQIAQADLDGCGGRLYKAELALARGQAGPAAALLEEALAKRGDMKRARTMLGECYLQAGKLDQAEQAFRTVIGDDPAYAPAVVGLAQATERLGKLDDHEQWVERGYRIAPTNPYIRQQHMIIRAAQAGPQEVQQLIQQRERMLQQETTPQLSNRLHLAVLYERSGQLDKAEQALRFVYDKSSSAQKLAAARLLAGLLVRRSQSAQAEKVIQELLAGGEDKVGVYLLYGDVLAGRSAELALGLFDKARQADPKDARSYLAIARLHAQLGRWNEAASAMKEHVDLRPGDRDALKEFIRYCLEAGQIDLARAKLDQVLSANRGDLEAATLRGTLLLREGDVLAALQVFQQAVGDHPDQALPLVWRAQALATLARLEAAGQDLRKAQQLCQDNDLSLQIAELYLWLQDVPSAEALLASLRQRHYAPATSRLISLYSLRQNWSALEGLLGELRKASPQDAGWASAEAGMWMRRNQPARAAAVYESMRAQGPVNPARLREHLLALIAANELDKALALAQAEAGPAEEPWLKAVRAHVLARQRQAAKAEELFRQALQEPNPRQLAMVVYHLREAYGPEAGQKLEAWTANLPHAWLALLQLGDLHIAAILEGDKDLLDAAERIVLRSRERAAKPAQKAQVERRLGAIYGSAGKADQAEKSYLAALALQADDPQALNNLAYLYANDLNQAAKALPYARKAFELARNDPNVLDTLGWVQARLGQLEPARQVLLRAIQSGSGMPASCYHLGWTYENDPAARLDQAAEYYRMGLRLSSQAGAAQGVRQLLEKSIERVGQKAALARSGK